MASITSAGTGLASATATWVGGVVPVVGDKVTIASGHTVTLDGAFHWGDDTSTAISVIGTLKASRVVSSMLTVRGTLASAGLGFRTGTIDFGTPVDPIPAGITATLRLNESAAMAANKWIAAFTVTNNLYFCGAAKRSWTRLSAAVAASATTATVDDATNWAVGDAIGFVGTNTTTATHRATITAIAGTSITFTPAMAVAKSIRGPVANFTRNVVVKPFNAAFSTRVLFDMNAGSGGDAPFNPEGLVKLYNMAFEDLGSSAGGNIAVEFTGRDYFRGLSAAAVMDGVAIYSTVGGAATFGRLMLNVNAGIYNPYDIRNTVVWMNVTSGQYQWNGNSGSPHYQDSLLVSPGSTIFFDSTVRLSRCYVSAGNTEERGVHINGFYEDCDFAVGNIIRNEVVDTPYRRCSFGAGSGVPAQLSTVMVVGNSRTARFTGLVLEDCTFPAESATPGAFEALIATGEPTNVGEDMTIKVHRPNGDASRYVWRRKYGGMHRDPVVRRAGDASIRHALTWALPGKMAFYDFPIPSRSGVQATVVVYLRKNASYGAANLPKLTLSGLGIAPTSFTMTDVNDTWVKVTLAATQSSGAPGNLTLRWEGFFNGTAGSAMWLDGLYFDPFTSSARHYGYVFDEKNPVRVPDASVSLTEAAALALPVTVNHANSTITVSGVVTPSEVYQACIADLCSTVNLDKAQHITFAGSKFVTSYTVVNPQNVTGAFTDATGARVFISAPALIAGSRVQLYNVTKANQVFNEALSGAGLSVRVTFTSADVIRLRAEHATKLPLETAGVLSDAGLTFLDVQLDDTVYLGAGIDGASVTEFSADGANLQIDLDDPDGVTSVQRLYAWMQHYQTTAEGIASPFFGALSALDAANYVVDQGLVDLKLDNVSANPVRVIGGHIARKDGSTIISSNSGSIQMDPGKAYAIATGGAGANVDSGAIAAAVWGSASRTLTSSAAPSSDQVALAVRAELAVELGRIDASITTRLPAASYVAPSDAPAAAVVAAAVRAELSAELARVDAPISTRLPTTLYEAPSTPSSAAEISASVWAAPTRTLTVAAGLTPAQEAKIDQTKLVAEQIQTKVDAAL